MPRTTTCPTCKHKAAPHKEGRFLAHSKPGRQAGVLCRNTGNLTPRAQRRQARHTANEPRPIWTGFKAPGAHA